MARRKPPSQLLGSGLVPSIFDTRAADLRRDYGLTIADLLRQEGDLFRSAGFKGKIVDRPDGGYGVDFDVDPTNNFGSYQQMLRDIGTQLLQARQSATSMGIRGGLARARQQAVRRMAEQNKTGLLTGLNTSAGNLWSSRGRAASDLQTGLHGIEGEALNWWEQSGPEDEEPATTTPGFQPSPSWVHPSAPSGYQIPPGLQQAEGTDIGQVGGGASGWQPARANLINTVAGVVRKNKPTNKGWY